jgi:superkiller protein 3
MKIKPVYIALSVLLAAAVTAILFIFPEKPKKADRLIKGSEQMLVDTARKFPNDPEKLNNLGVFYLNHNMIDKAMDAFKESIRLSGKYGPALENLGFVYYKKGDYDNALIYLNKALEVIPDTATLHNTLGAVYRSKKMHPEALRFHKKAIELDPKYYEAYYNIALVYQDTKDRKEEGKAWRKYIEKASSAPSEANYITMAKQNLEKLKK